MTTSADYSQAVDDFQRARRRAALSRVFSAWAGKSPDLLSYDDVREKLKATETPKIELREIPLKNIVGSVGRYADFTRGFLPLNPSDAGRWAKVKVAVIDSSGVPPIEVYQIGETYFVLDGNHRVSVARNVGAKKIEAYVRQVDTKIPLSPDTQPDDLIIKAEYAEFLERTAADVLLPDTVLSVTAPGIYHLLTGQILNHQRELETAKGQRVPVQEAVVSWYEQIYQPVLDVIQERRLLRDFPGRTETDLYFWLTQNRENLEQELGWEVSSEAAAANLAAQESPRVSHRISRARQRIADSLKPAAFDTGPAPGKWRREHVGEQSRKCFVEDILVPLGEGSLDCCALDQALTIAEREAARLQGLFVLTSDNKDNARTAEDVSAEFERRCAEAGIPGRLAVEAGRPAEQICARAYWTDLVILDLSHPPGGQPIERITSGIRTVILRCPTPILTVSGSPSAMRHGLLAFDGSPKSKEALYLSTYLACRWDIELSIVTVRENDRLPEETLLEAAVYAEDYSFAPNLISKDGDIIEGILQGVEEQGCDFIVMGGYGHSPLVEAALGSTVDEILRSADIPVLVCR